jgi:hypothetical protein
VPKATALSLAAGPSIAPNGTSAFIRNPPHSAEPAWAGAGVTHGTIARRPSPDPPNRRERGCFAPFYSILVLALDGYQSTQMSVGALCSASDKHTNASSPNGSAKRLATARGRPST